MNQNKPTGLSDQEMLTDALSSQKFITDNYNLFANECILNEEHQIQHEVFTEMQKRGWYPVAPAQQEQINQAKQKYTQMKP